ALTAQHINPTAVAYASLNESKEESGSSNSLHFMARIQEASAKQLESKSNKYAKYFSLYINTYSSLADAECNVYFNSNNSNNRRMLYKLFKKSSVSQIRYKDRYYSTEEFFQKHVL
ncbi:MAG TPA: hypothetical protein VIK89_01040, partial [Cytophagaceae bacterium]